jgi:inhibitor of KinA sporulation pathway (predicted exonuclease)
MLPKDCENHSIKVPKIYSKWINIKRDFEKTYKVEKSGGIPQMTKTLGISMTGRLHSGIDDCGNIAKIVLRMLEDGWTPPNHNKFIHLMFQ